MQACLKDERVGREDAEKGKVRVFSVIPFPVFVYMRKYSVPIIDYFRKDPLLTGVAAGINPHSHDFHNLGKHLIPEVGWKLIAGDYKGWEFCIPKHSTWFGYRLMRELLPPTMGEKLMEIAKVLICNRNLLGKYVYYRNAGTSSGNPFTFLINCLNNKGLIWYTFLEILKNKRHPVTTLGIEQQLSFLDANIRDVYYGDDHIISISPRLDILASDLASQLLKYDITYTDEDKGSKFKTKTSLEEVTFLKRRFYLNSSNVYVGLLLPEVIFETLLWHRIQNGVSTIECISAVLESMRSEVVLYGTLAWEFYELYIDFIYDTQLKKPKPRYNYLARALEIDLYSNTTPPYFFSAWKNFHESLSYFTTMENYIISRSSDSLIHNYVTSTKNSQ